jgi:putative redox protein
MRFATETGTGRSVVFGDEAVENELSPVEMVTASLAACSAMDVVSIALKKRQRLVRYEIRVTVDQRDEYPQVLTSIDVLHEVEGPVDPGAIRRCIELSAEKYCPVNAMLSAGATEVHHRMRILRPGEDPLEEKVVVTGPYRRPDVIG